MPLNHSLQSMVDDGTVKQTLFVGTVVNNADPLNINRVQVTISGRLAQGSADLPWMAPMRVSPFGQGAGFGVYGAPQVGSQVIVEAQEGNLDHAFYVAGYYGVSNANASFASPDVWGFQDPSGTYLIVNLATKVWTFHHASGLVYSYDASGNYVMQVPGNDTETISGNWSVTVGGNVNITSTGNTTVKAAQATIDSPDTHCTGSLTVDGLITGKAGIAVSGGTNGSTISGNLIHSDGSLTSNGVTLDTHDHNYSNGVTSPPNKD